MDRYRTGVFAVVLGLALVGSAGSVSARANEYAGEEMGRFATSTARRTWWS